MPTVANNHSTTSHESTGQLEAILLVGGQGTRLRPLTIGTPKPLLPTAGVPFLAHQIAKAAEAGVTRIVMATAYRAEMFAEVFGDGAGFGLEIVYVHEDEPLGTGGGIRNAAARLRSGPEDPVVVLNGDVLSGHDLGAQLDLHRKTDAAVTLHLVEVPDPARFGCVPTDFDGRVTAFLEKMPNPVTSQINAGCYVFTRRFIDAMPPGVVLSVERETFPGLIRAGGTVMGYLQSAYWLDVGTPEAYVRGSSDLVLGELASPAVPGECGQALLLPGATADPSATIIGGTAVGADSAVAAGAVVHGSVLFDGVTIGEGAKVTASVIGAGASIGAGAVLDGVVIGRGAEIGPRNELRHGMRVWPGVRLGHTAVRFSTDALRSPRAMTAEETSPAAAAPVERQWTAPCAIDVKSALGVHRRGYGDPAFAVDGSGAIWRACQTPEGAGTLRVAWRADRGLGTLVTASAWGEGAGWLLAHLPAMIGADDRPEDFVAYHDVLRAVARWRTGLRIGKSGLVLEALVPAVLEQKVVGKEATRAWRTLLRRFGEPAPGPAPAGLRVPPTAQTWAGIPSWEWHKAGVEAVRARTIAAAARVASRLEEVVGLPSAHADRRLRSLPGIGPWTSAEVRQRACGDADAVSIGDYHLPTQVGWALVGRPVDDAEMLELLEPYEGHRHRASLLAVMAGAAPARRAPRTPARDYRAF